MTDLPQSGPPRPRLALRIGITGHRLLDPVHAATLPDRIGALLRDLAAQAGGIAAAEPGLYAPGPPLLTFLTQLAAGADQIAAQVALDAGYALQAVLPLDPEEFRRDFDPASLARFDSLLAQAQSCWFLPGQRSSADQAYALAGAATVAQCDLLLAVWDGAPARGPGGTADVVDNAVRRGVPVFHLPPGGGAPMLLWSGLDRLPPTLLHRDSVPRRVLTPDLLVEVAAQLLLPGTERALLADFFAEHERRWRPRIEFPLLLAAAGIQPIRRAAWRGTAYPDRAADDWRPFREAVAGLPDLDCVQHAFAWADGLAEHYSQLYRSGTVFNFVGAALAVLLALAGFLWPAAKPALVALELALIAALIVNTRVGTRRDWHRRWLDARLLAEQLRTMRSLKLFSLSRPPLDPLEGTGEPELWTQWYATAIWRQIGVPPTLRDPAQIDALSRHVAVHDLDDQVAYHRRNAHRMHLLDHRLHRLGGVLFAATGAIGAVLLAGYLFDIAAVHAAGKVLGVLTAALPTIGSAVFGLRGAGDFIGAATRSARTAGRLGEIATQLRRPQIALPEAACATEEAAVTMLRDLRDWRSAYRNRVLAIPA